MLGGGLADLRRMPSTVIDEGPQRTRPPLPPGRGAPRARAGAPPVLLVPPLAAPAICFDLRRGCSVAEHLAARRAARPTSSTTARSSSPTARSASSTGSTTSCRRAIRAAAEDAGGRPVQVVGWCLGGILSLLALAADRDAAGRLGGAGREPVRLLQGAAGRAAAADRGGHRRRRDHAALPPARAARPRRWSSAATSSAGIDKYLMKPWTVLSNLHDRELLAQIEAVDAFMDRMHAYPGRTFGQLYHRFFRTNDLADGRSRSTGGTLDLADVRVPVLAVAGRGDGIAPVAACHHVEALLPQRARCELATAPGGHLGVLTGRAARRDDVAAARRRSSTRRVLQGAVHGGQSRGRPRPERLPLPPHARARPPRRAPRSCSSSPLPPRPRRRRPGAADRARRQGRRPRRRRPHGRRGDGEAPADATARARPAASPSRSRGRRFRLTMKQAQARVRRRPDRQARATTPAARNPAADVPLATSVGPRRRIADASPAASAREVYLAPRDAHDPHHAAPHLPPQGARPAARSTSSALRATIERTLRQPDRRSRVVRPARKILKAARQHERARARSTGRSSRSTAPTSSCACSSG